MTDEQRHGSGTGEFFAVDRASWAAACGLGMNPAVAFLVLARFSQRDNRTTAASVHAVEEHTGIARGRAREAIDVLLNASLARLLRDGTRPLYELVAHGEIQQARRPALTDREAALHERLTRLSLFF